MKTLILAASMAVLAGRPPTASVTYIEQQDFEGAGTPTSWSISGGANADSTTSPLAGAQSLRVPTGEYGFYTFSPVQGEIHGKFLFRAGTLPASFTAILEVWDASVGTLFQLTLNGDGTLIVAGGGLFEQTTAAMSANTLYYVWFYYKKGTGANSEGRVWFAASDTRPANGSTASAGNTNGTSTADLTYVALKSTTSSITCDFDNVKYAAVDFQ